MRLAKHTTFLPLDLLMQNARCLREKKDGKFHDSVAKKSLYQELMCVLVMKRLGN